MVKYRVQVGTGLGLISKNMDKEQADRIAKMIDSGGMKVWVIPGAKTRKKVKK